MKIATTKTAALLAALSAFSLNADTCSFAEPFTLTSVKSKYVNVKQTAGNRFLGNLEAFPKERFPQMKVSGVDGTLTLNTRDFDVSGKDFVVMRMHIAKKEDICRTGAPETAGKISRISIEIKSDAPALLNFGFEGSRDVNGQKRHWAKMKKVALAAGWQTLSFEQEFPVDLAGVWARFDFLNTVNVQIRKISFEAVPKK